MDKNIRRLPDSELMVMQAIWNCTPPVSKADIEEDIYKTHPMAETTLLTLLTRLTEKGYLSVEIHKRRKYFTPCITRQEYLADQSKSFIDKLCGGSMTTFATALCNSGLSKEELAELRDMLERGTL